MTSDESTAAQPARNLPLRWRLWFAAGLLAALFALFVGLHWAHQVESIPTGLSALVVIVVTILVLAGCVEVALTRMDTLKKAVSDLDAKVDALATSTNDVFFRQLSAAPTVRLHEVGQAVERVVGVAKTEAVREISGKVDELWERFGDLEADLASFRMWQKRQAEPAPRTNGSGRATFLRSLPSQPD